MLLEKQIKEDSPMGVINTNIASMIGLNNLRTTNLGLQTSLERLSSGLRINKGADDPSGLAISKGMEAQLGGIRTAVQNAEDGKSLIHTADGALAETQNILFRMRDLSVRAANVATLTTTDILKLNSEVQSLKQELARKSQAVTFNTKVLFSGGFSSGQMIQIGPDNGAVFRMTMTIQAMTLTGLNLAGSTVLGSNIWGLGGIDGSAGSLIISNGLNGAMSGLGMSALDTPRALTMAQIAIDFIQSAINMVSTARANLGIQERRIDHIVNDLKAEDINISAAKSRIYDADMANEISEFTRLQILQQSGTAILAQANAQPQSVLQLLR
jgi:flagellin